MLGDMGIRGGQREEREHLSKDLEVQSIQTDIREEYPYFKVKQVHRP